MRNRSNSARRAHNAFPSTRFPLCALVLLVGIVAMLPVSVFAQSRTQNDVGLQSGMRTSEFVFQGVVASRTDAITDIGNAVLAKVAGKYVPVATVNPIRREPSVILWDEGGGTSTHTGTRLQSGGASNHQHNSLTVVGQ